jgi:manganese transport protein
MDKPEVRSADSGTVVAAGQVLTGQHKKGPFARLLPFLGPAFIASIAYVDPGNFATNIQGGAQFGYMLLWVVVVSNLMAMLVQTLSAKLGIASGMNLAEACRERFPRPVSWGLWVLMEVVAMSTDLAEFLGAALGFYLLFHIPLLIAGILTAIATFIILALERYGFRPLEATITSFVGIIAGCYLIELIIGRPDWAQAANAVMFPKMGGKEGVLLASGILGATVMPHVIFLHSALTQGRIVTRDPKQLKLLLKFEITDIVIAMGLAGFVNAAMLMMAAAAFFPKYSDIASIELAHKTLTPLLGGAASWVFAISLLASGLSSSAVGTMSGQVIMQGFIRKRIAPWIRRLVTMIPSLIVIAIGLEPTRTLVISQVVLSFGLPFAIIPLVYFTAQRDIMGVLTNNKITTIAAVLVAALIVTLNVFLLYQTLFGGGG